MYMYIYIYLYMLYITGNINVNLHVHILWFCPDKILLVNVHVQGSIVYEGLKLYS